MIRRARALQPTLTLADLFERFGAMPIDRIRHDAPPGWATEEDVIELHNREKVLCELVDGVLVEKAVGFRESCLAALLIQLLGAFVRQRKLGVVTAPDGMMRLAAGLVRIPDVAFVSWDRLPGRRVPREPIPDLVPDLAVEVLSAGNTEREMKRKPQDYFGAGTKLVWFVDPDARTVEVFTAPDQHGLLREGDTLDGGEVLPGFTLPINELFAELDAQLT